MTAANRTPGLPDTAQSARSMSDELVVLLRERVASRFYDRPQVIDALARRLLQLGSS